MTNTTGADTHVFGLYTSLTARSRPYDKRALLIPCLKETPQVYVDTLGKQE